MNVFFLLAALLILLLSVAHAVWGERKVFQILTTQTLDPEIYLSVYVPWHQLTYILALSGVALIVAAFDDSLEAIAVFVLGIVVGNLGVFVATCVIKKQTEMFSKTVPQTILFSVLIGLLIVGIVS